MNRTLALLWLTLTLLPVAYLVFFVSYMTSFPGTDHTSAADFEAQFSFIFRLHITAMFTVWALIATYIIYLFKTTYVPTDKRALWAVVLFLGNMAAMPFFWYLYVWRPLQSPKVGT